MILTKESLRSLSRFDTPTIFQAVEEITGDRSAISYTTEPALCLRPEQAPIAGLARTARLSAAEGAALDADQEMEQKLGFYSYLAEETLPKIAVLSHKEDEPVHGSFLGQVETAIMRAFGAVGAITDGTVREAPDCAPQFQVMADYLSQVPARMAFSDQGEPVTVFGMKVHEGDLIVMDRHGAVVMPQQFVPLVEEAVERVTGRNRVVLLATRKPNFGTKELKDAYKRQKDAF